MIAVKKKESEWVLVVMLALILLIVLYALSRVLALQRKVAELELTILDEKTTKELIHEEMGTAVSGIRREISTRLVARQEPPRSEPVRTEKTEEIEIGTTPELPAIVAAAKSPEWNVGFQNFTRTVDAWVPTNVTLPPVTTLTVTELSPEEHSMPALVPVEEVLKDSAEMPREPELVVEDFVEVKPSKKKGGKKPKNGGTEVKLG